MAISITWRNIFVMVAMAATLFSGLVAGTGVMIQWRFDALQSQLSDRMTLYQRELTRIEQRLDTLERTQKWP